jgi:site-specific DNA-methyltransferase (adenine-specific)
MGYSGRARYEGITLFSRGPKRFPRDLSMPDVLGVRAIETAKRVHPSEKPIGLLSKLIRFATNAGETVLDCFAGSCSTGIAALGLGRNAVLIERALEHG